MPKSKKILLIAGNYFPEVTGIGRYNSEMIDWLADNGFDCTVISTYPHYPHWEIQSPYNKRKFLFTKEEKTTLKDNKITIYRCPHYVPANPTGKKRILFDLSFFAATTLRLISLSGKKYDYIINVTPPLTLGFIAALYKKISGAAFLYHIQDLQVDLARDLNMISSKKVINLLLRLESYILKQADKISTISEGMFKKISAKTNKHVFLFPNWTNTSTFYPVEDKAALKLSFGLKQNKPVVLYSGAIGEKQRLEDILHVAKIFQDEKSYIQFVICGSSPYKAVLSKKAIELDLNNIAFMPLQPNEKLNAFLNMADVHLVIQKASAADLVMPSKLNNILSVGGLAIITANKGSGLYATVEKHKMGILCNAEDIQALKNSIEQGINGNNAHIKLNARNYAENYLSIDKIMHRYVTKAMNK